MPGQQPEILLPQRAERVAVPDQVSDLYGLALICIRDGNHLHMLVLQHHQQSTGSNERAANERFRSELLVQKRKGKNKCDNHAQLVDRHDL